MRIRGLFFLSVFLPAVAVLGTASASAQPAAPGANALKLGYTVYLGGLNVFDLGVNLDMKGERYQISGGGQSKGMIRMIWKWAVEATAMGEVNGKGVISRSYDVTTTKKEKRRGLRLVFSEPGAFTITRTPPDSWRKAQRRRKYLPKTIPPGTLDPISVAMAVADAAAQGRGCGGRFPVFDGNRRYDVTLTKTGEDNLKRPGFSVFSGHTIRCQLAVKRISGFRQNKVALRFWDEAQLEPPVIWLARLGKALPVIPVQFQADFNLGYMIIYLTKAQKQGRSLLAAAPKARK